MTSDDQRPDDEGRPDRRDDPWLPAAGETSQAGPARPRRRGLLLAAIAVFAVGVVFTILAALSPFLLGRDAPTALYLGAMFFTPIGFLLGLAYAILGARPPKS